MQRKIVANKIIMEKYLVYENWQAQHKAVVHKSSCGNANNGHERIQDSWLHNNNAPNDRWFGYFSTYNEALAFASLLPNRQLKICSTCLHNEKNLI